MFFTIIDEQWDILRTELTGPFTTQSFRLLLEDRFPQIWEKLVAKYGAGGKGSGNFYSPSNVLFNYLERKTRDGVLIKHGFAPSLIGWGANRVMQWELTNVVAPPPTQEDRKFIEGKPILRTHLVRERAQGLRAHVLNARKDVGLSCDLCLTTGDDLPDELRDAMFEVHHNEKPLAFSGETTTTLDALALLCASCHRVVHRLVSVRNEWFTVEQVKAELQLSMTDHRP
ncbi:hypothetical protein QFZ34_003232 [Phyllobacterium ifriqiyense]|uniref:HNH domain-containing protein n=1 Tax=Phyllobacterium ifriqiyense TaxID=314238 RepID=A0ABU0SDQ6_9HYPH|nr:hypothetical protein [Phyllobacterium ifriqiyense]MDQ0998050.1 hypothetical protein [Phyllobacterium ifriqiyense]